jgi:cell division cycle 2-like
MSASEDPSSSSPSRKRSKWDDHDEEIHINPLPQPKRRARTRPAGKVVMPDPNDSDPPTPSSSNASRPRPPAHSIYVPPRTHHPSITPSRSVYSYERLNQIEEGSYGVVYRARDKQTGDIVALKKLKLDEEKNGFPITALREVNALMSCRHQNVVRIREVVVGETLTQYVSVNNGFFVNDIC